LSHKFATFLRNELCSNNLNDFGLKKGLDNLDAVRQTFKVITSRFAGFQGAEDVMAMLDLIDNGSELAGQPAV
jgi:hypothetical protein